jgi:hypothetical protein
VRLVGGGSRVAVIAWLLALAAGVPAPQPPPGDPKRARLSPVAVAPSGLAQVEPATEPPTRAPPAEPPPPTPPAGAQMAPPPEPTPGTVAAADVAHGDALLSGGRFPVIHASYDSLQGFSRYAAAMTALGGRFVVVSDREIAGEIDVASGALRDAALDRHFSPRARDYTDEPALAEPIRRARARFGPRAEIVLLVPRALDAGLFGGIARELAERGFDSGEFREVEGRYERGAGGELRFRLVSGLRMDGARVDLRAVFDLAALAAGGSP